MTTPPLTDTERQELEMLRVRHTDLEKQNAKLERALRTKPPGCWLVMRKLGICQGCKGKGPP